MKPRSRQSVIELIDLYASHYRPLDADSKNLFEKIKNNYSKLDSSEKTKVMRHLEKKLDQIMVISANERNEVVNNLNRGRLSGAVCLPIIDAWMCGSTMTIMRLMAEVPVGYFLGGCIPMVIASAQKKDFILSYKAYKDLTANLDKPPQLVNLRKNPRRLQLQSGVKLEQDSQPAKYHPRKRR